MVPRVWDGIMDGLTYVYCIICICCEGIGWVGLNGSEVGVTGKEVYYLYTSLPFKSTSL